MQIGLDVAQQRMPWDELVRRARFIEDAGFDGLWGFDHFQPMYGSGPGECFEAYTTLAALAGVTERVRLGVLVTGVTYRHPSLLAAEAITVDHASHGRLELTLGCAWFDKEHTELGFPFPPTGQRLDMTEEALQILRGLLTTDGFTLEGAYYQVRDATLHPRPVQTPHPPIWIGGGGERRTLPMTARHADAWHTFGDVETLIAKSRKLDELAEAEGRDPAAILRAASLDLSQPWGDVRRTADELRSAGFGYLICGWPSEGETRLEEFVGAVMPDLRAG
jgi:F420-dependent oxidoreductase-like protein